jgi:hypothetical protein
MNAIDVRMVTDKKGTMDFLQVPFTVFKNDPNWVAPLFLERLEHLSPKKNPYFKHAKAQLFVAYRDGKPVGRISAQIDELHLQRYKDGTGQFGFLDAIDDAAVFKALLAAAEDWQRKNGMTRVLGPFSFSINDETGLLIDGFDTPPSMMMGHGRNYYASHVEAAGFRKAKDVFAYDYDLSSPIPPVIDRAYRRSLKSSHITVRPLDKKNIASELKVIMSIFNDAWSDNWGYVPFTEDELKLLGTNLKMLVTGNYVAIAMHNGEPAAMAVTLPNLNEWIAGMDGKLLPFNFAKLIPRVIGKKPRTVRLPLMGVRKAYHDSTVGSALAFAVIMAVREYHVSRGVERCEMSWVLEDNMGMRNIIETAGAKPYKTYRTYEKSLA